MQDSLELRVYLAGAIKGRCLIWVNHLGMVGRLIQAPQYCLAVLLGGLWQT